MTYLKALEIRHVYRQVEAQFDDKSTAFILEVAAERCRSQLIYPSCDCSDVADALIQTGEYKPC